MRDIYGLFVAGGSGVRMGAGVPKQFLSLGECTILERTILSFVQAIPDIRIIVALPTNHFDTWKGICRDHNFDFRQTLVQGGLTRFHSVKAALEKVPDGATVLIHDGVRPLVSSKLILQMAECPGGAAVPVVPVTDTLKRLGPDLVPTDGADPSREGLFGAQTPQAFHSELIRKAYELPYSTDFTDDASVARAAGIPVRYLPGEKYNVKITTPEDLDVAKLLLKA